MTTLGESSGSTIRDLMTPDLVLPDQYFTATRETVTTGERALQWAVFADGIDSYRRLAHARSRGGQREFMKARAWVMREDWEWLYSFVNLCITFGFEPSAVRQALLRMENEEAHTERRRRYRHAA